MSEQFKNISGKVADAAFHKVVYPYLVHGEAAQDREIAHTRALRLMQTAQDSHIAVSVLGSIFQYRDPILETSFAGITVPNPLGLAAGFDKNAQIYNFLGKGLGFGSVTVGSITRIAYEGNPRPRIFNLPDSKGTINRMGFPGDGLEMAVDRLRLDSPEDRRYALIVNFSASKPSFENGTVLEDFAYAAQQLAPYGEAGEGNASSPNTPGVRALQEPEAFVDVVDAVVPPYIKLGKPVRFKFGPDLELKKLVTNARTIVDKKGSGITLTNTSVDPAIREKLSLADISRQEVGGISGAPITQKALDVSHALYTEIGNEIPIHRIGGIATIEDVWNALTYGGATTVDIYTSFVRLETASLGIANKILKDLAQAMRNMNMTSMEDFKELRGKKIQLPL